MKYECNLCGYICDLEKETCVENFPDNWTCPVCGLSGFVLCLVSIEKYPQREQHI
ncbi:MAG: rubredoxin [Candidatus Eremiobacterota bacterium]